MDSFFCLDECGTAAQKAMDRFSRSRTVLARFDRMTRLGGKQPHLSSRNYLNVRLESTVSMSCSTCECARCEEFAMAAGAGAEDTM